MDKEKIRSDLEALLKSEWKGLVTGAKEDKERFAVAMATEMTEALVGQRPEQIRALKNQVMLIAEKHRLRVVSVELRVFQRVMGVVFTLIGGLA